MQKVHFYIAGMDCSEEAAALKRVLQPLAGDSEENLLFDLINGKLTVILPEDSGVTEETLRQAVAKTGMTAVSWTEYCATGTCAVGGDFRMRRGRMILCGASGLLVIAGFLIHAVSHGFTAALAGQADTWRGFYPAASVVSYIGAVITGGWFIFPKAAYAARAFRPDMNLLMVIAVTGAIIIGELFEAGVISFLFAAALLLESWSVGRARRAIGALVDLSPATARYAGGGGTLVEKPVEQVPVGAAVTVRAGEKIPLDGAVISGSSYVDQSPITGESKPVLKQKGDEVFAGSINGDGTLEFRSTKPAANTTLARIIRMVEESQARRAPAEQWVEKFARYYTPAMMLLAVIIAIAPPLLFGGEWNRWLYEALVILVIGCPCALVISTPVSIVTALTTAARAGVLVKGGVFIESASRLKAVAFDKTGTITTGKPVVQDVVPERNHTREEILKSAASLEEHSTHPLARAILERAREENIRLSPVKDFSVMKGKGAEGSIDGRRYWIGSHRFLHEHVDDYPEFHARAAMLESDGSSVVTLGTGDHVCGLISIGDHIRDTIPAVIASLKNIGLEKTVMLTGDNEGTAKRIASEAGTGEYRAELLPEDKVAHIQRLIERHGHVAMVGDGVNDAPALAASSLGIAMGAAGSDAAIETADVALMSDDLSKLPWFILHARRTLRIIKQNIVFALGLKLSFIILAGLGIATLWMAIAADMGASLAVIFNSLRLLNGRKSPHTRRRLAGKNSAAHCGLPGSALL